jgi:hypothetical protein
VAVGAGADELEELVVSVEEVVVLGFAVTVVVVSLVVVEVGRSEVLSMVVVEVVTSLVVEEVDELDEVVVGLTEDVVVVPELEVDFDVFEDLVFVLLVFVVLLVVKVGSEEVLETV